MKKIFLFAVLITAALTMYDKESEKDDLFMMNVEALSQGESSNYNICYSQSVVAVGYTYYDCGSCEKVYDERGKGKISKCFK